MERPLRLLLRLTALTVTLALFIHCDRKTAQPRFAAGQTREDTASGRLVGEALALLKDPNGSPQTAALLAVEALRRNHTLENDAAVRPVLSALLRPARVLRSPFPNGRTLLSPSGHHVAFYQTDQSAPTRGVLSIREVLTGKELARVEVAWQKPPATTPSGPVLTFWNDGRIVAVSAGPPSADTEVFYYDVKTGARKQEAPTLPQDAERSEVAQGPSARPSFLPRSERIAAWSPDRQRLATLDGSGNARVWDVASGKPLQAAPLGCSTLQFSRDLRWLFGLSQGTGAVVWRWAEDRRVARAGDDSVLAQVALMANEQLLVTAAETGVIRVWELPDRQPGSAYALERQVYGVKIAQGGSVAIAHLGASGAIAWAVPSGLTLHEETEAVYGLAISSDGKTLALRRRDALDVLDLTTGRSLLRVELPALHTDSLGPRWEKVDRTIYLPIAEAVPRLFDAAEFTEEVPFRGEWTPAMKPSARVKRTVRIKAEKAPAGTGSCYPDSHLFIDFEEASPRRGCPQYWETCSDGGDWMDKVALSGDGSRVAVTYLDYVFVFATHTGQRLARAALGHRSRSERGCSKGTGPGLHTFHALPQQLWFQNESGDLLIQEKKSARAGAGRGSRARIPSRVWRWSCSTKQPCARGSSRPRRIAPRSVSYTWTAASSPRCRRPRGR